MARPLQIAPDAVGQGGGRFLARCRRVEQPQGGQGLRVHPLCLKGLHQLPGQGFDL